MVIVSQADSQLNDCQGYHDEEDIRNIFFLSHLLERIPSAGQQQLGVVENNQKSPITPLWIYIYTFSILFDVVGCF